ncbi:Nn.00g038820.m01.CDS01 [Neocucurbitaria sp. VM-36]
MVSNRQPELYAAALIPYTAAAVALVMRMFARRKTGVRLAWEDYVAIVAFLIGSGFTFISLYKTRWGLGIHLEEIDLPTDQIVYHYFQDLWVDMWLYTFSVGLSKFVILGFYWRVFSLSTIRQPIRILFACSVGWIIVTLILMQCQPIHKFWDKDVPGKCPLTPMSSLFGAGIPHFVLEVAILLCPMIEIWKLHMRTSKKIAVAVMFMSGFLVCGSALGTIAHTVALDRKVDKDLTWDGLDDQIWAVCDVNLASLATSLPLLRPVFRSFGGIFSGLKSSASPGENYVNVRSTHTYGNTAITKRSRAHKANPTDSEIEFADEGDFGEGSNKAYALHTIAPPSSEEDARDGIYVRNEMKVEFK